MFTTHFYIFAKYYKFPENILSTMTAKYDTLPYIHSEI